jgi:aminopeptidase
MEFAEKLLRLAEVCLAVGVNLQRGQELIITAPVEASALVRILTRVAYQRGAKLVTCLYDDALTLWDRVSHADDETLDYAAAWMSRGLSDAFENGAARLFVVAPYPDLFDDADPAKIVRVHAAMGKASADEAKFTTESRINWSTIPFVTASWARTVYPGMPPGEASRRLWEAVFDATRVNCSNPLDAWKTHNRSLSARRDFLQGKAFTALHFYDGHTDLTVGLADGHRWVGGSVVGANGVECICNIPTEEIFTCPHKDRTNGVAFFSKPFVLAGSLIDEVRVEFRDGRLQSVQAARGQSTFEKLIGSDEGAGRLGEIGLVPDSSPIAGSKTLFYNTLFDENAASHIAFGQSYAACLPDNQAVPRTPEEAGANQSSIHIDCMLGNSSMSVDGVHRSGHVEPVMRAGEFLVLR